MDLQGRNYQPGIPQQPRSPDFFDTITVRNDDNVQEQEKDEEKEVQEEVEEQEPAQAPVAAAVQERIAGKKRKQQKERITGKKGEQPKSVTGPVAPGSPLASPQ